MWYFETESHFIWVHDTKTPWLHLRLYWYQRTRLISEISHTGTDLTACLRGSLHESGFSFNPERHFKLNSCLHGRLKTERPRRMKISFRVETRFRFMYQQSYFFGDFSTYTLKYVNKTSHFANNLYFGHLHDSESTFHSGSSVQSGMKYGMNSIRNELQLSPDSCKQL